MVSVSGVNGYAGMFLWQTAGEDTYKKLLGNWLQPPRYFVRFALFKGDVADRAEEWGVTVRGDGTVLNVRHRLPETAPGFDLSEEEARSMAYAALHREMQVSPTSMRELSVTPTKQPSRTDWSFTFADLKFEPLRRAKDGTQFVSQVTRSFRPRASFISPKIGDGNNNQKRRQWVSS
jgi:hypothetical protein